MRDVVAEHFNRKKRKIMTSETVLVLRVCRPDMSSSHGFVWPTSGPVKASDWNPRAECGNGLHGWLWGVGDLSVAGGVNDVDGSRWLVVEVAKDDVIDLVGKVKFPRGVVIFVGDRRDAAKIVQERAPSGSLCMFGTATAGDGGTATAGHRGTATAGDGGTVMIKRYDSKAGRYRIVIGYIGEGLEANTPYRLDDSGNLVRKES